MKSCVFCFHCCRSGQRTSFWSRQIRRWISECRIFSRWTTFNIRRHFSIWNSKTKRILIFILNQKLNSSYSRFKRKVTSSFDFSLSHFAWELSGSTGCGKGKAKRLKKKTKEKHRENSNFNVQFRRTTVEKRFCYVQNDIRKFCWWKLNIQLEEIRRKIEYFQWKEKKLTTKYSQLADDGFLFPIWRKTSSVVTFCL